MASANSGIAAQQKRLMLEIVLQSDRNPRQLASGEAAAGRVVAVGRDAMPARAEIIVRAAVVPLVGIDRIPVALPVEMVLVAQRDNVGRVIDRSHARVARRLA